MTVSAGKTTIVVAYAIGAIWLAVAQPAAATQQFATQTGQSCGQCHVNPKGAGPLTPAGEAFKANGNKTPAQSAPPVPTQPK